MLFTIGHGAKTAEELTEALRRHSITLLVDVRSFPGSRRNPHVSKEAMPEWLGAAGIAYRHEPDLGGRRKPPTNPQPSDQWWENAAYVGEPNRAKANALYYEVGQLGCKQAREELQKRAKAGDVRGALEDIWQAEESGKGFVHFHHTAYNIASVYAILRQPVPALQWLRRTAEEGWPCYPYFASDPNLANIRDDPSFVAFMRELKAQWERYRATL